MRGQRRRRIPARFLPPILSGNRPFPDQEAARAPYDLVRIEIAQSIVLPKTPGQQNWKSDLVQLNAVPIWASINPEILIKAAVLALGNSEIYQRPQRSAAIAYREQRGRRFHQVASPNQMIAAQ